VDAISELVRPTIKPWAGIARCGGVGDNLMAASVFPALSRTHQIDVLTNDAEGGFWRLYENNPWISKITKIKDKDIPTDSMENWQSFWHKRAREYHVFHNLSHSCECQLAFPQTQTTFTRSAKWRRKYGGMNYLDAVAEIVDVKPDFTEPLFYPTEAEHEKAIETKKKVGDRCIGWCIAGSRLDKFYPNSMYVVQRLIRELGIPVIMFGASEREQQVGKATMEHIERANGSIEGLHTAWTTRTEDGKSIVIEWDIRRSLTQLIHCDLVIGPDTGALWSVAFEQVPKIVMLSHASVENISKYWLNTVSLHADQKRVDCWPCHQLHDTIEFCRPNKGNDGAACISDISPELVVEAARTLLNQPYDIAPLRHRLGANGTILRESFEQAPAFVTA